MYVYAYVDMDTTILFTTKSDTDLSIVPQIGRVGVDSYAVYVKD